MTGLYLFFLIIPLLAVHSLIYNFYLWLFNRINDTKDKRLFYLYTRIQFSILMIVCFKPTFVLFMNAFIYESNIWVFVCAGLIFSIGSVIAQFVVSDNNIKFTSYVCSKPVLFSIVTKFILATLFSYAFSLIFYYYLFGITSSIICYIICLEIANPFFIPMDSGHGGSSGSGPSGSGSSGSGPSGSGPSGSGPSGPRYSRDFIWGIEEPEGRKRKRSLLDSDTMDTGEGPEREKKKSRLATLRSEGPEREKEKARLSAILQSKGLPNLSDQDKGDLANLCKDPVPVSLRLPSQGSALENRRAAFKVFEEQL